MARKVYTIERTLKEVKVTRLTARGLDIAGWLMIPLGCLAAGIWEPLGYFVLILVLPVWTFAWILRLYARLLYWWHNA